MQDLNLAKQLRIIGSSQFFLDVLNIIVLLFSIIKVDVTDEVHDIGNINPVALHQLDAEVHIVQNRDNFSIFLVLCIEHQVFTLIVLIFLLCHDK